MEPEQTCSSISKPSIAPRLPVKALFGMLGVFAEFERSMIQERIHAGLNRARAAGKQLGRPGLDQDMRDRIIQLREQGVSFRKIAGEVGVSLSTVQRVLAE